MVIALTGTPGTGKTTVSEKLEEGFEVVDLTKFLEEKDIGREVDGEREVRIGEMLEELEGEIFSDDTVVEGHLAHHLPADVCIVLRCRPDILKERLSSRPYPDSKVRENVESEKIDIILTEAVKNQETVIEIDTTEKSVEETVEEIKEKLDERENDYGNVDWSEFI
ncbi:MAG: adenylate kinase family protein [Candidatus Nanohalobium sp.]